MKPNWETRSHFNISAPSCLLSLALSSIHFPLSPSHLPYFLLSTMVSWNYKNTGKKSVGLKSIPLSMIIPLFLSTHNETALGALAFPLTSCPVLSLLLLITQHWLKNDSTIHHCNPTGLHDGLKTECRVNSSIICQQGGIFERVPSCHGNRKHDAPALIQGQG